jgi:hypothetical protein
MALTRLGNIANTIPDNSIANSKFTDIVNFKNIIINGDMSIAQRGTSTASVTATGYNACDRWKNVLSNLGTFTVSQDTDVPTGQGFAKSLKMDCTTADASPAAGDFNAIIQTVEGQNLQYLKKGTANAESLTLSFWVKSNKTGTYTCEFRDVDNTRSISQTYTISSVSTWEKKTITIDGDTTGAFDNDNAGSFQMWFWLGAGSDYTGGTLNTSWNASTTNERVSSSNVNLADNTANEWFITGVQLEAGTTASDFEFLPWDVNLRRCLRYYEKSYNYETALGTATAIGCVFGSGSYASPTTSYINASTIYAVEKRASPTLTIYDFAGNSGKCTREWFGVASSNNSNIIITADANPKRFGVTSNTGDNRTHVGFQFTANAEL